MDNRSQWLRENYRTDMSEDEKAALLVEYHKRDGLMPIVRLGHTLATTHYGFVLGCPDCAQDGGW